MNAIEWMSELPNYFVFGLSNDHTDDSESDMSRDSTSVKNVQNLPQHPAQASTASTVIIQ